MNGPTTPADRSSGVEPAPRQTNRFAVAAMVCAGLGFSFLPLIGILAGFVFAARAERQILADPERYEGLEMVRWARRLAWLGVVILLISGGVVIWAWWAMNA